MVTRRAHAASTLLMRDVLREVGAVELPGVSATLRMSQGVHSGRFHFFAVGSAHLELLPVGPAWSRLVAMQHAADPDEILVSVGNGRIASARLRR